MRAGDTASSLIAAGELLLALSVGQQVLSALQNQATFTLQSTKCTLEVLVRIEVLECMVYICMYCTVVI